MAAVEGRDYVFARKMTYNGTQGVGKGCLVGTGELLLQLPVKTMKGKGRYVQDRDWFLDDKPVLQELENRLNDPDIRPGDLSSMLREVAGSMEGTELVDFAKVRRLKVKTSFFSRGIYTSEKSGGPGWRAFPLKKQDAKAFQKFYEGHPATMGG